MDSATNIRWILVDKEDFHEKKKKSHKHHNFSDQSFLLFSTIN